MQEFLSMGGYAGYVWSAFGLTLVVFIWNILAARSYHRKSILKAKRRIAMDKESNQ